ncbi:hypothetical protein NOCA2480002 [metagenome]|uniref:Uncharacterized protein n=1 Tax=metagenome TaxID=256318 RepID=A0A2P2C7F6_9ZZZZ
MGRGSMESRTATCARCGREVAVTAEGYANNHNELSRPQRCWGGGLRVAEDVTEAAPAEPPASVRAVSDWLSSLDKPGRRGDRGADGQPSG